MADKTPLSNVRSVHGVEGRFSEKDFLSRFAEREAMLRMLTSADAKDAAGAALAFLLHMVDTNPAMLKAVLRSPITKPGCPGGNVIDILNRVVKF